jgi:hypothetical protein
MLPHWWNKMYSRNAKGIDLNIWNSLMKPVTSDELRDVINNLDTNLSPDMEGNNSTLIKAVFSDEQLLGLLLDIINKILEWGDLPVEWKCYYISLIEKKPGKIVVDSMSDQLRPIAITHEYAKLVSKILATRLNIILLENDILTSSQRAFIRSGSVHQCISTLLNIIEDGKQKYEIKHQPFFLISYDMKKAYDKIHSIRPTLERFNMPGTFIKYKLTSSR